MGFPSSGTEHFNFHMNVLSVRVYNTGAIPRVDAYYGEGTLAVQFDNLTCSGTESGVLQCSFTAGTSCTHNLDVGVQCPGKTNQCGG